MSTPAPAAPAAPAAPTPAASAALTPPAPAPAPAAAPAAPSPPPGASAAPTGDWTTTLDDDSKGYIANKGFKSPAEVLNSYRNLEKLHGAGPEKLVKLPEDMNTPEGRALRERLGAPKEAKDYGLDKIMPAADKGGDPKLAEWAAGVFHEIGLPVRDAEKIMTRLNERNQASLTAAKENYVSMLSQGETALKKEWGAAYDQNINLARQGMKALELDGKEVDGLERMIGRERLFKKLKSIGAGVGEGVFVGGRPAADGALAPEQARQKLKELNGDPVWAKRFLSGETEAKQQMEKLQRMAYPGEMTV